MLRRIIEVILGLGVIAAATVAGTFVAPMALPRVTVVEPPRDQLLVCSSPQPGTLYAQAGDMLALSSPPGEATLRMTPLTEAVQAAVPLTLRGVQPSGGILLPGTTQSFLGCQPPASSGLIQILDAGTASLLITNPDATDAAVDLSLYGADGEILALGSQGVVVGPHGSRTIALSVLSGGSGPLAVGYRTSRGRVAIVSDGAAATVPMQAAERHLIPGIAGGRPARLILSNPGTERATAQVFVLGAHARLQPASGANVTLGPGTSLMLDLTSGIAGEDVAVEVNADRLVGATVIAGDAGALNPVEAGRQLSGFGPGGGQLQLSNPGESELSALVTTMTGDEDPVSSSLAIPGGTTLTQALPEGDGIQVRVEAPGPLVGALVHVEEASVAAIPLRAIPEGESEPVTAELVPTLR